MKKECIAMLLAGGQGSRLYVLTSDVAKPAVKKAAAAEKKSAPRGRKKTPSTAE